MTKVNTLNHLASIKTYLVTYLNGQTETRDTYRSAKGLKKAINEARAPYFMAPVTNISLVY